MNKDNLDTSNINTDESSVASQSFQGSVTQMEQEKHDEEVEERLVEMMKEMPVKLISYFLCILGREMVSANADTMDLSQQMDVENNRYKIVVKATIKPVKSGGKS